MQETDRLSHTEKEICTTLAESYSSINRLLKDQRVTNDDGVVANMEDYMNRLLERYGHAYQKTWTLELKDIDYFYNRVVLSKEYDQGKLKPATEYYVQFIGEARKLAAYMKSPKDKQINQHYDINTRIERNIDTIAYNFQEACAHFRQYSETENLSMASSVLKNVRLMKNETRDIRDNLLQHEQTVSREVQASRPHFHRQPRRALHTTVNTTFASETIRNFEEPPPRSAMMMPRHVAEHQSYYILAFQTGLDVDGKSAGITFVHGLWMNHFALSFFPTFLSMKGKMHMHEPLFRHEVAFSSQNQENLLP